MRINAVSNTALTSRNDSNAGALSKANEAQNNDKVQAQKQTKSSKNKKFQKKDGILVSLNKQLIRVKKQLADLEMKTNIDREQKKEMKKNLTKEMGQINSQILERQLQIMKAKEEEEKKKVEQKEENKAKERIEIENKEKLNPNFLKVTKSLSKLKHEHAASEKLASKARILKGEIDLDEGRGVDATKKREQLFKMENNLDKLAKIMSESMIKVNSEFKKGENELARLAKKDYGKGEKNPANTENAKNSDGKYKRVKGDETSKKKVVKKSDKKEKLYYVSTNKVDREIDKIKKEKEELSKKIASVSSVDENPEEVDKLKEKLNQVETELNTKDNDVYRKLNSEGHF